MVLMLKHATLRPFGSSAINRRAIQVCCTTRRRCLGTLVDGTFATLLHSFIPALMLNSMLGDKLHGRAATAGAAATRR